MKRIAGVPILITLFYVAAFVVANLDGYHLHLYSPWQQTTAGLETAIPEANWIHGWPIAFAVRPSMYSKTGKNDTIQNFVPSNTGVYSRWPIESYNGLFDFRMCAVDFAYFLSTSFGVYLAAGRICKTLRIRLRFSILFLLAIITASACLVYFRNFALADRYGLQYTVLGILYCGGSIAILWTLARLVAACRWFHIISGQNNADAPQSPSQTNLLNH